MNTDQNGDWFDEKSFDSYFSINVWAVHFLMTTQIELYQKVYERFNF